MISYGNRTSCCTIQGVIGRFEITSMITPELYDNKLLPINCVKNTMRETEK